jgi:hypothetical protein
MTKEKIRVPRENPFVEPGFWGVVVSAGVLLTVIGLVTYHHVSLLIENIF